jgi:MoaA/NifB/PqqE/SkfB family radical SAM enzyme
MTLFRGLLGGDFAATGPFFVDVDVTRRCNLRCVGCPYHSASADGSPIYRADVNDLPPHLFERLCDELRALGTRELVVQGSGEPLLHPEIFEMLAKAKAMGFRVILLTNGTLIDEDAARNLLDSEVDVVKVSLWASSADQYAENQPGGKPDGFGRVVRGLELLGRLKRERGGSVPKVVIYHVINRNNFDATATMADLAVDTGCDGLFFAPMGQSGVQSDSTMLSPEQERVAMRSLERMKKHLRSLSLDENVETALLRYSLGNSPDRSPPCYIAWFHARVRTDGVVQGCGRCDARITFGNLHQRSFGEIWNGPEIRAFRRTGSTREGLASLSEHCNCEMCCFAGENLRVHRFFRWFIPLAELRRSLGALRRASTFPKRRASS